MTKKNISLLDKFKKVLIDKYAIEDFDYEIEHDSTIILKFPGETGFDVEYEFEELEKYCREIDSLVIHENNSVVSTNNIVQQVIRPNNDENLYNFIHLHAFTKFTQDNIRISLVWEPILIGIAACHLQQYDKYNMPLSDNYAIEIVYPDPTAKLSEQKQSELIKIFLFEISNHYKVSFDFPTYLIKKQSDKEIEREEFLQAFEALYTIPIEDYNFGMDLFLKANQPLSSDLKYISFYKIFEYFAPVKARIEAFESMRAKLATQNVIKPKADFLASVFKLAKNYERSLRDEELIKTLLSSTFDLVDCYPLLPKNVRKKIGQDKLSYAIRSETKQIVIEKLGTILYQTRNSIVHAKSNFESRNLECSEDDLDELNNFMHNAAFGIIAWYNSLPNHLKINFQ